MNAQHIIYQKLDEDFKKSYDPWNFTSSKYEKERFEKMLSLIKTVPHDSILEVGCAEGYFTEKLKVIARTITAIDVSKKALERAKKIVEGVTFQRIELENLQPPKKKYDLVVCSEVLNFLLDKKGAVEKLRQNGKYLLICQYVGRDGVFLYLWYLLRRFKQIKRTLHWNVREKKACMILLLKLG